MVIGSAMDIVTHCQVPRYLHNNLPLGNPLGEPFDEIAQLSSVKKSLSLAATATDPIVVISDLKWSGNPDWQSVYNRVDDTNREELLRMGEENRRRRAENKTKGLNR